jgi:hypothetical protein
MAQHRSRRKTRRHGRSMKARMRNDAQETIREITQEQQRKVDAAKERRRKKRTQTQGHKGKPSPQIHSDEEGQPEVSISEGIPPSKNKVKSPPLGLQRDTTTGLLLPVQILPPSHSRHRKGRTPPTPPKAGVKKRSRGRSRSRGQF